MIRADRFALDLETFTAERRSILDRAEDRVRSRVEWSLIRKGLPGWEDIIVEAALEVFDDAVELESEGGSPTIDILRDAYALDLRRALEKTTSDTERAIQVENITRMVATSATNAGTEAAAAADPADLGLEWLTMQDSDVRHSHREMQGMIVPLGGVFEVDGYELQYPGQPVGPPEVWINCRCVARPTTLNDMAAQTATFADDQEHTSAVVVALPAPSDPVNEASAEDAHVTLLFLGDSAGLDPAALKAEVQRVAGDFQQFTDQVSGSATLGGDRADVVLFDAVGLQPVRASLLAQRALSGAYQAADQYPTWIPHLTLGYPDRPRRQDTIPENVTFDRLALWHGDDRTEFPLGGPMSDSVVAAAEDATEPDAIPEDELYPDVPWNGVLAPEGVPSGDGRSFSQGALTFRPLPLPLKYQPTQADGHDGSVVVGRIDRIWRDGNLVRAEGVFDQSPMAYEAIRMIANDMIRGVSVDVDDAEVSLQDGDLQEFSSARIAAATLCSIPAFAEAFVTLGPWGEPSEGGAGQFAANPPGAHEDGTPPKCDYCDKQAVGYVLHSEGMAFIPACADHMEQAKSDAEASTPSGEPDPSNIDRVGEYTADFAPVPRKTKDGPGWITHPRPTKRITDYWVDGPGAAKIGWGVPGDFNRCRTNLAKYVQNPEWLAGLCANLHYRALRAWPGQRSLEGVEMARNDTVTASVTLDDGDSTTLPAEWFRNPELTGPTPFNVTDEGRVFGHIATWDVCHLANPFGEGECVTAPKSKTNYAYFLTGEVLTDAGRIPVGQVSLGGGHAGRMGLRAAIAHYDSTSTAVADITVGEDEFGIWAAGAVRPGLTEATMRALRGASLSGDWRRVTRPTGESNLEMVAALAVNVPGYPIPRVTLTASGGRQESLVAAAIPTDGEDAPGGPKIGDRVRIDPDRVHDPEHITGTITEIGGTAYGLVMDGMPGEVHRWYTAEEFEVTDEEAPDEEAPEEDHPEGKTDMPPGMMDMAAQARKTIETERAAHRRKRMADAKARMKRH